VLFYSKLVIQYVVFNLLQIPSGLLIPFSVIGNPFCPTQSILLPQIPRLSWIPPHASPAILKHALQHPPVTSVLYEPPRPDDNNKHKGSNPLVHGNEYFKNFPSVTPYLHYLLNVSCLCVMISISSLVL